MNEEELRELRALTPQERFRQVVALFDSRHLFGPDVSREAEEETLRERWKQIRRAYGA